ncbi:MAG: TlpA family protein disulfide reductase [Xanthomonadales bacterium]|nr:TlpA family protein disulfide reductase [Xanthomonadales bacterium]
MGVCACLALFCGSVTAAESAQVRPALRVETVQGGMFDLSEQRGTWVVVNFWATWCAPCREEIPMLAQLDADRSDVEVIGLAFEEISVDHMKVFIERYSVTYPVSIVDVYAPPDAFEVPRGLPMTHVIAPDGRVAKQFLGPVTREELEAVLQADQ